MEKLTANQEEEEEEDEEKNGDMTPRWGTGRGTDWRANGRALNDCRRDGERQFEVYLEVIAKK